MPGLEDQFRAGAGEHSRLGGTLGPELGGLAYPGVPGDPGEEDTSRAWMTGPRVIRAGDRSRTAAPRGASSKNLTILTIDDLPC